MQQIEEALLVMKVESALEEKEPPEPIYYNQAGIEFEMERYRPIPPREPHLTRTPSRKFLPYVGPR